MKKRHQPWILAVLLAFLTIGSIPASAEATDGCRSSKGGSSTDALGEEFPEVVLGPVLAAVGLKISVLVLWIFDDGLGEEFPEKSTSKDTGDALGEEFPE
ncbi:MAG: hypothetical protein KAY32_16630 [Candidatus Eisenbacteria sp.]|nr:hypothetical protein [Candidatus Eisenbacteria bacterium]